MTLELVSRASAGEAPSPLTAVSQRSGASTAPRAPAAAAGARLHWIDWLRVAAIAAVFVYHTLRPFNTEDWHVKNAQTSDALTALMGLFWSFGLAVLFLLAGAGARFALRRRTWQTFVRERTARLLVPFIAGTLLLSPLQGFIEATHKGAYSGSYVGYLGVWIGGLVDRLTGTVSPTIFGVGYHLWFLGFLFAISVLTLPLLEWLRGRQGGRVIDALARMLARRGTSLLFVIPITVLMTVGVFLGTDEHGWFEFAWYGGYFLIGFVLVSDERFLAAVRRDLWPALGAALLSSGLLTATPMGGLMATMVDGLDWPHLLTGITFAIEGWAWTIVILNVGLRAARLQVPVSQGIGDGVLPVYVIHQPVILAVAFLVVQLPMGILPKWILVFGMSLGLTLGLVELALHARISRLLLGARSRPAPSTAPAAERAGGTPLATRRPPIGVDHGRAG